MLDNVTSIVMTAFAVTAVGIALRPGAPTASVVTALTSGVAKMQLAAFGPTK